MCCLNKTSNDQPPWHVAGVDKECSTKIPACHIARVNVILKCCSAILWIALDHSDFTEVMPDISEKSSSNARYLAFLRLQSESIQTKRVTQHFSELLRLAQCLALRYHILAWIEGKHKIETRLKTNCSAHPVAPSLFFLLWEYILYRRYCLIPTDWILWWSFVRHVILRKKSAILSYK